MKIDWQVTGRIKHTIKPYSLLSLISLSIVTRYVTKELCMTKASIVMNVSVGQMSGLMILSLWLLWPAAAHGLVMAVSWIFHGCCQLVAKPTLSPHNDAINERTRPKISQGRGGGGTTLAARHWRQITDKHGCIILPPSLLLPHLTASHQHSVTRDESMTLNSSDQLIQVLVLGWLALAKWISSRDQ